MTTKKEWDRENMATLACRVRKDEAARFKAFCNEHGTTVHGVFTWVVNALLTDGSLSGALAKNLKLAQENELLRKKLAVAVQDREIAMQRAERAEGLVDLWLRSADGHR